MSDFNPSSTPPQFGTAEYETAGPDHCNFCNQPVGSQYYRVGDATACAGCALRLQTEMPAETAGVYARGLLFGIGAAIVGMALYATVTIVTGWEIGLVSLAVGWLVGKGVVKGANGFGGRKYQLTAVALTYFAVSVAAVPIGLSHMWKNRGEEPTKVEAVKTEDAAKGDANAEKKSDAATSPDKAQPADPEAEEAEPAPVAGGEESTGLGTALVTLLLLGLASPFLALANPVNGLIGLVILFVGLQVAWQLTGAKALVVDGPFPHAPSSSNAIHPES